MTTLTHCDFTTRHPLGKGVPSTTAAENDSRYSSVVERVIGNDEVGGSIPPGGTIYKRRVVAAFWSKVDVRPNYRLCWFWRASLDTKGYGQFKPVSGAKPLRAHRVAWEIWNGIDVPEGMLIRHTCDNPKCCNPVHLSPGTSQDNSNDMVRRGRSTRGRRQKRTGA